MQGPAALQDQPEIREMKAENDLYSVSATFSLNNKPMNPLWNWTRVPQVNVTARAMLPSTSVIQFTLGAPEDLELQLRHALAV